MTPTVEVIIKIWLALGVVAFLLSFAHHAVHRPSYLRRSATDWLILFAVISALGPISLICAVLMWRDQ